MQFPLLSVIYYCIIPHLLCLEHYFFIFLIRWIISLITGLIKRSKKDNKSQKSAVSRAVDQLRSLTRHPPHPPTPSSSPSHLHPPSQRRSAASPAPPPFAAGWDVFLTYISHSPFHLAPQRFHFSIFISTHHPWRQTPCLCSSSFHLLYFCLRTFPSCPTVQSG